MPPPKFGSRHSGELWFYTATVQLYHVNPLPSEVVDFCFFGGVEKRLAGSYSENLEFWRKRMSYSKGKILDWYKNQDVDSHAFEKSVHRIGEFLGFTSQMPEEDEGDGPDNLWRMENGVNLVIEVKNNSTNDRISRSEI
jgi:hypothetical protein